MAGPSAGRDGRHVPALAEALEEYEANRNRFSTLDGYFPRLLEVFGID